MKKILSFVTSITMYLQFLVSTTSAMNSKDNKKNIESKPKILSTKYLKVEKPNNNTNKDTFSLLPKERIPPETICVKMPVYFEKNIF